MCVNLTPVYRTLDMNQPPRFILILPLPVVSSAPYCMVCDATCGLNIYVDSKIPYLGLCSMGISGKHVVKTFGPFEDIKVRYVTRFFPSG